jgi:hypothetical protein
MNTGPDSIFSRDLPLRNKNVLSVGWIKPILALGNLRDSEAGNSGSVRAAAVRHVWQRIEAEVSVGQRSPLGDV